MSQKNSASESTGFRQKWPSHPRHPSPHGFVVKGRAQGRASGGHQGIRAKWPWPCHSWNQLRSCASWPLSSECSHTHPPDISRSKISTRNLCNLREWFRHVQKNLQNDSHCWAPSPFHVQQSDVFFCLTTCEKASGPARQRSGLSLSIR